MNVSALRQAIKDNYTGNKDYFSLADDGDKATVVFVHASEDDINWGKVYEVKLPIQGEYGSDGQPKKIKKYVLAKGDTDPLATVGMKPKIRALFQLVEVGEDGSIGDIKVWDRGPNHIDQILTFMDTLGPLNTYAMTIVRNGKKGSTQTKYQMIPGRETINPETAGIPKPQDLAKDGYMLDLSLEDMAKVAAGTYYLPKFENNEAQVTPPVGGAFAGQPQAVIPAPQAQPQVTPPPAPKPVFNTATGQWEFPQPATPPSAPVVEKAVPPAPPQPKLVDGMWHTPQLNTNTNQWEYPTIKKESVVSIGNENKTTMF